MDKLFITNHTIIVISSDFEIPRHLPIITTGQTLEYYSELKQSAYKISQSAQQRKLESMCCLPHYHYTLTKNSIHCSFFQPALNAKSISDTTDPSSEDKYISFIDIDLRVF